MSSKKNRDLAQELVDFLLKEEQEKKPGSAAKHAQSAENKNVPKAPVKPTLVPPLPQVPTTPPPLPVTPLANETYVLDEETLVSGPKKSAEAKTVNLASLDDAKVMEFTVPGPKEATESMKDLVLETSIQPEFKGPEGLRPEMMPEALKDVRPELTADEFKNQPSASNAFKTQRSKIVFNEVSTLMAGAEAVKVAQARITVLERDKSKLRDEIDQLLLASESLQRRLNELKAEQERSERHHKEKIEIVEDEKTVLRGRLKAREEELDKVKKENDELKLRFQTDLRKVRVRERELETRSEIMKAENASVIRAKDESIVELKRQLEKLHFELDNFRAQSADLNARVNEFYDRNHRTVKALRLALTVLEAGDGDERNKKTGS